MGGGSGSGSGSGVTSNPLVSQNPSHQAAAASASAAPKILLAKPGLAAAGKFSRGVVGAGGAAEDDSAAALRSRLPSIGSLNLLSDSWDFIADRFLPFLTDNTDFTVVGVIGPPGAGKSTILNEIYGYDATSPGILPPFAIQSEETRAMAKHCTTGIEPRISSERIILLDTQPVFSPSVLAEMIRPDGSSTVSVINGESLSAELAHELMTIQGFSLSFEKENKDKILEVGKEYMAVPVIVQTKLHDNDIHPRNAVQLKKALQQYFSSSSYRRSKSQNASNENDILTINGGNHDMDSATLKLFLVPCMNRDDSPGQQYESYISVLWKIRDQVLSMSGSSFSRIVSERDWLKNSAKIWDMIKNSPIIADYCRMLQSSGMFRR